MCGIVAIVERDPTRLAPEGDLQAMVRRARASRPRRRGPRHAARRGPGHAPAGDRRPGDRAAADRQRDRRHARSSPTARSTTSSSCAHELEAQGPSLPLALVRHRVARARLRGVGRGLPAAPARHVRGRDLGRPHPDAAGGARPRRREAALLHADRARPAAGLRGEGAAGAARGVARARPRGARPVPHLRVRDRAAHDAQGRRTSCRPGHPPLPRRHGDGAALLGSRPTIAVRDWTDDDAAEALRDGPAARGRRAS